jgi:hypothetical protein
MNSSYIFLVCCQSFPTRRWHIHYKLPSCFYSWRKSDFVVIIWDCTLALTFTLERLFHWMRDYAFSRTPQAHYFGTSGFWPFSDWKIHVEEPSIVQCTGDRNLSIWNIFFWGGPRKIMLLFTTRTETTTMCKEMKLCWEVDEMCAFYSIVTIWDDL